MFVFMEKAADAIVSVDVQVSDRGRIGDRLGEWA